MSTATPPTLPATAPDAPGPTVETLEHTLRELLAAALPAAPPEAVRATPGRPAILPALLLWTGLLVGILRGFAAQCEIWRLLAVHGLWDYPRVPITEDAVYQRLARTPATALQDLFARVTAALRAQYPDLTVGATAAGEPLAAFATGIYALDHTVLEPVARKVKLLRGAPPGDKGRLPGALGTCFDVRRQQWERVLFTPQTEGNLAFSGPATGDALRAGLPTGSLLLADLGFFSFAWFDALTDDGYSYVSRLREKVTYTVEHVFYHGTRAGVTVRDSLIYLGRYRADRAAHPVRLVELTVGAQTYTYLTNVLDPRQLPVWEVQELYRRRWNIEQAFHFLKTDLGLHLLWSGHTTVVQQQVFATLILAQIALALRTQVAQAAGAEVREVSLPLLVRWLPRLAAMGRDPLAEFIATGRQAGYIRPFRGRAWVVPAVPLSAYQFPARPLPWRAPRYGTRDYQQRRREETGQSRRARARAAKETTV
jgi:hypothetical protein